jgi:lipoprotein-releasing system permease protein
LGVRSSIVDAYPVKLKAMDFVYTGIVVVLITLMASYIPARNASRTVVQEQV